MVINVKNKSEDTCSFCNPLDITPVPVGGCSCSKPEKPFKRGMLLKSLFRGIFRYSGLGDCCLAYCFNKQVKTIKHFTMQGRGEKLPKSYVWEALMEVPNGVPRGNDQGEH